jgi:arachidonate 15-lipoxygenase
MFARQRFGLYRFLLGRVTAKEFKEQKVWPLELPASEHIEVEPLAPELPRLFGANSFPTTEHAAKRLKKIKRRARLLPIVSRLPAAETAAISENYGAFLAEIYPTRYRKIWPTAPAVPPEFESDDLLAALAVSGPFAMYLQHGSTVDDLDTRSLGTAGPDDYVIDMTMFERHPAKQGLLAPGGLAVLLNAGDRLRTKGVISHGELHQPGDQRYVRALRVLLCAVNTHLTTLVHNVTFHLGYVTPMTVASSNELPPDHPIRRLLHPAFQTTLIGNHEVAAFQIVGEGSFATKLFSHDYATLVTLINDHLHDFRPVDLDPEAAFARSGLVDAPLRLPFWDDDLALWKINWRYVDRYVRHYYDSDAAVAADRELEAWVATLDRLLPSGLYDDRGYLTAGRPLTQATLARLCATYLHTSSATHDVVNNAVWDYSTLNYVVPTVVPESLEHQDVRLSFDLMNTIVGTWKSFNMLVDGVSDLALDEAGRLIMDDYVNALLARQAEMDNEPRRSGRIYPAALNPSVSN